MKRSLRWITVVLLVALLVTACGEKATPEPTATPVPPTSTPKPPEPTNTPEPEPTDTPEPEPTATPEPEPTAVPAEPEGTPVPPLDLDSGWYHITNGNFVRDFDVYYEVIVAATGGGVVIWEIGSEDITAYYTYDGLLPTNDIEAVAICAFEEPEVYVGTEYGLSKFNSETETWDLMTPDNSGMDSTGVDFIDCDEERNLLLVGYTFGLDIYDFAADTWTHYDEDDGLVTDWVNEAKYIGDDLWIVSSFGSSVVHPDGSVEGFNEDLGNIPDENVSGVAGDAQGNIWMATFDGLMKYSNGEFTIYNSDNVENFPFLDAFEKVLVDEKGMVWAGNTFGSICEFDPAAETCVNIYEDEEGMVGGLDQMVFDEEGNLFFSDDGEGISGFDGETWYDFVLDEYPLRNSYNAITQMPDGTVWLAGSFGLQILDAFDMYGTAWEHNDMDGYSVNSFFHTPTGVWIAQGAGASFYEYESEAWTHYEYAEEAGQGIYDGGATVIAEDGMGRVWFGTYNGLTVMDGDTFTYYDLLTDEEREEERSARTVKSLLFDGTNMWVGAYGALFRFDENDEITMWDEDLPGILSFFSPSANALALDQNGAVLLGMGSQLLRYDAAGDTFEEVFEAESDVYSIVISGDEIWLGTYSQGAAIFNGDEWLTIKTKDGLQSNYLNGYQSILIDSSGTAWFAASDGGLSRLIP